MIMSINIPARRKAFSIQLKVGLTVIAFITTIFSIFGGYQYYGISIRKTTELRMLSNDTAEKLSEALALPMWTYAKEEITRILLSEMRNHNIYALLIREAADNSISTGKIRDKDWQIIDAKEEISDEFMLTQKPIVKDQKTLGTVEVYLTQRFLQEELTHEVISMVVIVLVLDISIFIVLIFILQSMLLRPINKLLILANGIAAGNFDQTLQIRQQDEIGVMARALQEMQQTIQRVLQELQTQITAIQQGKLTVRGKAEEFAGSWRDLIEGVNSVVEAFVGPLNVTAAYIEQLSKSDIPLPITCEYQGDFNKIKHNLNMSGEDIRNVLQETSLLSQGILAGDLQTRGKVEAFGGGWRELVVGVNRLIEAFVSPITVTATYLDRIAKGDVPEKITAEYQGDFNLIKTNVNSLIDAMQAITQLAQRMAEGELTIEITLRSEQDALMRALHTMLQTLNDIVTKVKAASNNVNTGSQALNDSAAHMSQGATEQAAAAEQASASVEQMVANIKQNSENAQQTERIALKTAQDAKDGGQAVVLTAMAMQKIIQKILIVEEIARQTHMLSLNASIEAAKAQEYGKGFGVVASEVRALAQRAQSAAGEIGHVAGESIAIAERAGEILAKLVPDIQRTAELVQEITAASKEQSAGAEQINRAIQQADQITQQNATIAEQTASSAEELFNQAQQLQDAIAFFTLKESFQEQESQDTHQKKGSRSKTSKKQTNFSGKKAETEETDAESDDFPASSSRDDTGKYDDGFERY